MGEHLARCISMTKDKSIFIKNIYYMLSYAFQTLNQENYDDVAVESFDEMYDLLAAILARGIGIQLKQGLYREYINRQEELPVMRGKINLPGTIKNRLARKQLLTCDYDELSENNLLNQIIKTAVMLLLRNAKVKAEYKDDLKKKMLFFSDVDTLEPTSIPWSSIRFQRNNQTYGMLISICQLIIEGMLITTDAGEYRLASFVDEQRMCRLYEKFILEYYSKHFPELSVSASQIPWSVDDGIRTMLPVMQSDIHLQKGNTVLIIDAKYYRYGVTGISSHLPESSSINKQITYGEYIYNHKKFKDIYGDDVPVYNAFLMPYNKQDNPFHINEYFANIGEADSDWKYGNHNYERVQGIVVDIRFLMNNYYGSHKSKIIKMAKLIEEALQENADALPEDKAE